MIKLNRREFAFGLAGLLMSNSNAQDNTLMLQVVKHKPNVHLYFSPFEEMLRENYAQVVGELKTYFKNYGLEIEVTSVLPDIKSSDSIEQKKETARKIQSQFLEAKFDHLDNFGVYIETEYELFRRQFYSAIAERWQNGLGWLKQYYSPIHNRIALESALEGVLVKPLMKTKQIEQILSQENPDFFKAGLLVANYLNISEGQSNGLFNLDDFFSFEQLPPAYTTQIDRARSLIQTVFTPIIKFKDCDYSVAQGEADPINSRAYITGMGSLRNERIKMFKITAIEHELGHLWSLWHTFIVDSIVHDYNNQGKPNLMSRENDDNERKKFEASDYYLTDLQAQWLREYFNKGMPYQLMKENNFTIGLYLKDPRFLNLVREGRLK